METDLGIVWPFDSILLECKLDRYKLLQNHGILSVRAPKT